MVQAGSGRGVRELPGQGPDWQGSTLARPTAIGKGRRTNRLLLQPSDTNQAMSFPSSVVKEVFSILDLELPWRRVSSGIGECPAGIRMFRPGGPDQGFDCVGSGRGM
jgi:hypothetical protein